MTSDLDLLRQFARENSQGAFAEIVQRHLNLVYSAALRQVRSPQLAEEVAQSAFADLARNAGKLSSTGVSPVGSLTPWLYAVTRRTAIDVIRKESRRQLREQIAVEMNTMNATADEWTQIAPLLDDAMAALDEADRSAVLLRYFENKSLREVGAALGASEDAAQKRVSRAVERLREVFSKRNVVIGASGLAVLISANAVQSAPVGLAAAISIAAVLAGTAVSTSTAVATTKVIAMTALQKTIVGAALVAAVGTGIFEEHQASRLHNQVQTLQQQQTSQAEQIRQLQIERDDATNRLAVVLAENAGLKSNPNETELLKLREEVTQLKNEADDPTEQAARALMVKVKELKQRLDETPDAKIPELQFLTDQDWINAANGRLDNDAAYRRALSTLRKAAEGKFAAMLNRAVIGYIKNSGGHMPTDLAQLQPYFDSPVNDTILQRWEIAPANAVPGLGMGGNAIITQKAAVDDIFDTRYGIGPSGFGSAGFQTVEDDELLGQIMAAYSAAHNGDSPGGKTGAELLPYATTPQQQAVIQKMILHDSLIKQAY